MWPFPIPSLQFCHLALHLADLKHRFSNTQMAVYHLPGLVGTVMVLQGLVDEGLTHWQDLTRQLLSFPLPLLASWIRCLSMLVCSGPPEIPGILSFLEYFQSRIPSAVLSKLRGSSSLPRSVEGWYQGY